MLNNLDYLIYGAAGLMGILFLGVILIGMQARRLSSRLEKIVDEFSRCEDKALQLRKRNKSLELEVEESRIKIHKLQNQGIEKVPLVQADHSEAEPNRMEEKSPFPQDVKPDPVATVAVVSEPDEMQIEVYSNKTGKTHILTRAAVFGGGTDQEDKSNPEIRIPLSQKINPSLPLPPVSVVPVQTVPVQPVPEQPVPVPPAPEQPVPVPPAPEQPVPASVTKLPHANSGILPSYIIRRAQTLYIQLYNTVKKEGEMLRLRECYHHLNGVRVVIFDFQLIFFIRPLEMEIIDEVFQALTSHGYKILLANGGGELPTQLKETGLDQKVEYI